MIPEPIKRYLDSHDVEYRLLAHPLAVSGSRLAQSLHVSGWKVAKCVLARSGARLVACAIPAAEQLDTDRLEAVLGEPCSLATEREVAHAFPGCEVGAAPPFGSLWGLDVVLDSALADAEKLVVRAGNHEEAIELSYEAFADLELPTVASIARPGIPPHPRPQAAPTLTP